MTYVDRILRPETESVTISKYPIRTSSVKKCAKYRISEVTVIPELWENMEPVGNVLLSEVVPITKPKYQMSNNSVGKCG